MANEGNTGNVQKMKNAREKIIKLGYKFENENVSTGANEIIDIVHDYPWVLDNAIKPQTAYLTGNYGGYQAGTSKTFVDNNVAHHSNVPVCYMVERKSVVNAAVANILNIISTLNDIAQSFKEGAAASSNSVVSGALSAGETIVSSFKKMITGLIPSGANAILAGNNLNDEILNPYRYLYITAATGKKYVFPLTSNEASSFMPTKLAWADVGKGMPKIIKSIFDMAQDVTASAAFAGNVVRNFASLGSQGDDNNSVSELPKSFTYPKTGDAMQVQFTLYNTTKKNAWRDNYRFLYLFAVRNMPFRTETLSFVPPLLYDIIVPGIKRMPVSALTEMKVVPKGMIRLLQCDNFIDTETSGRKIQVSVPEAWEVTLKFQSLIAPSANLMLSNIIQHLNIEVEEGLLDEMKLNAEQMQDAIDEKDDLDKQLKDLCKNLDMSKKFDAAKDQMQAAKRAGYAKRFRDHINLILDNNPTFTPDTESWYDELEDDPFIQKFLAESNMSEDEFNAFCTSSSGLGLPPTPIACYNVNSTLLGYEFVKKPNPYQGREPNFGDANGNYDKIDKAISSADAVLDTLSRETKKLWETESKTAAKKGGFGIKTDAMGKDGFEYSHEYGNGDKTPPGYLSPDEREQAAKKITELTNELKLLANATGTNWQDPCGDVSSSKSTASPAAPAASAK
jgi:hypothetical protein